jgi:peptidoglycan/LPS O-acetylase OafA/YrhL
LSRSIPAAARIVAVAISVLCAVAVLSAIFSLQLGLGSYENFLPYRIAGLSRTDVVTIAIILFAASVLVAFQRTLINDGSKSDPPATKMPKYFYSLDVLRGFAALSVVVFHYRHFAGWPDFPIEGLPIQLIFGKIYLLGYLAVHLFFVLSGFIFFCLYGDAIASRTISAFDFFILRFSRLYPLHLATLVLVICVDQIYLNANGRHFAYGGNAFDLVKNLFLVQYWFPDSVFTFNGPSWSVSVEALLYLLFFIWARHVRSVTFLAIPIVFGLLVVVKETSQYQEEIGTAVMTFFAGGAAFHLWKNVFGKRVSDFHLLAIALLLIVICAGISRYSPFSIFVYFLDLVPFPSVIVLLAMRPDLGKSLRIIGNISYSTYMLHFPVQIVLALVYPYSFFDTAGLLAYLTCVLALAAASYYKFELPIQSALRRQFVATSGGRISLRRRDEAVALGKSAGGGSDDGRYLA